MAIPLGRPLPNASCDRPERRREGSPGAIGSFRDACRSYLVLLPVGFSLPPPLPAARCALTAPFHPCRPPGTPEGLAVYFLWHFPWGRPRRALPGTVPPWSPDFPLPAQRGKRPSDRLASTNLGCRGASVKASSCRPAAAKEAVQHVPEILSAPPPLGPRLAFRPASPGD